MPHGSAQDNTSLQTRHRISKCSLQFPEMLKRLSSYGSRSEASNSSRSSARRSKPTRLSTPLMRLALQKVSRGETALIMSQIAKASVEECGAANCAESR